MSRFDACYDGDGEAAPYEFWQRATATALGSRRGQAVLEEMEAALLALPEPKLIRDHLSTDQGVCAVGAFLVHRKAKREGVDTATVLARWAAETECWCGHRRDEHAQDGDDWTCSGPGYRGHSCDCDNFNVPADEDGPWGTAEAGKREGMAYTVAWHLASLNDEKFYNATPAERYQKMLAWVRRAQGKEAAV